MAESFKQRQSAFGNAGQGIKNLFKFNKRERQISPSSEGKAVNTNDNRLEDLIKNKEDKRQEREDKRMKKGDAKRMKDIEIQSKLQKKGLRREVRYNLAQTNCETLATFCFIVTVGTLLFGGGTALIVTGRENNIIDFIVVGSSGIIIGIIFTSAGIVLIFKPVYEKIQARRKESTSINHENPPGALDKPFYYDDVQRTILTAQISDEGRSSRRPSNVELYGDPPVHPAAGTFPTPVTEAHSKTDPPLLAMPNIVDKITKEKTRQDPVFFLNANEGREDSGSGNKSTTEVVEASLHSPRHQKAADFPETHDHSLSSLEEGVADSAHILQRERSESPLVIVSHHGDSVQDKNTDKNYDNSLLHKSTPSIIVDDLLTRQQSVNTIQSAARTPTAVMLTYDNDASSEIIS